MKIEMNKKTIIISISIVLLLLIMILLIPKMLKKEPQTQIIKYITNLKFTNSDNSYLYSKQVSEDNLDEYTKKVENNINSEYEILYFNINTYQLTKDEMTYDDGINKNFTPTYDYTNNDLTYTYRVNYDDINILIEGKYNIRTKEFICTPTFSYGIDIENSQEAICNKVKFDIETFEYETKTIIENHKIIDYIKNNNH